MQHGVERGCWPGGSSRLQGQGQDNIECVWAGELRSKDSEGMVSFFLLFFFFAYALEPVRTKGVMGSSGSAWTIPEGRSVEVVCWR